MRPSDETGSAPANGAPPKNGPETARLDRIRERCEDGSYAVPSRKVADKIVRDAVARIRKRQK